MPFNRVLTFGNLGFYESIEPLVDGRESKARGVESSHGGSIPTVYRFPIEVSPYGYLRFREIAQFANANFHAQLPTTPQEFQDAYNADKRWKVWDGKIIIGLNHENRPCAISENLAKEFLEHDSHPATIGVHLLAAAGSTYLLESRRRQFDQRFQADGLSVARRVKQGIHS